MNIRVVSGLILFVLSRGLADDPSPSDIDTFFQICNDWLDSMQTCGDAWIYSEDYILQGIMNMSDRIVYTETLILDEAKQIGVMADRIVETEYLMANLTEQCMPMCDSTDSGAQAEEDQRYEIEPMVHQRQLTAPPQTLVATPSSQLGSCSPLAQFNDVLNTSKVAFDQLCSNMTTTLNYMVDGISDMADRIVGTECLIMDMSKNIGIMADRIVVTEQLMANMTADCCQSIPTPSHLRSRQHRRLVDTVIGTEILGDDPAECANYTYPDDDGTPSLPNTMTVLSVSPRKVQSTGPMPCETWWNPFCCAMEVMTEMMDAMIEEMASVGGQVLVKMMGMADIISTLADQIVDMEHEIMDMADLIGVMADEIVETEQLMLDFAQSTFCDYDISIQAKAKLTNARSLHTTLQKRARKLTSFTSSLAALNPNFAHDGQHIHTAVTGYFGNFAEMVDLMTKMATTMASLMSDQMDEVGNMMTAMTDMGNKIVYTASLIVDMGKQIDIMGDRIVQTESLMFNLTDDCLDQQH